MKNTSLTSSSGQQVEKWAHELAIFLDRLIYQIAKHWLWTVNGAVAIYTGLPILAPWLMAMGWRLPAHIIYFVYSFLCHQLPQRSFFLFGYQMAFCQRCTAIYGSVLLGGMLFPLVRRWLKPLPWKLYLLLNIPIAVDGITQLLGLRESNAFWRVLTGSLFGLSSVWLIYPYLEQGFADIRTEIEEKLDLGETI